MTIGRPFGIGDWIVLGDGTEGRVVESTWRSTQLLTASNNVVSLPNSLLARLGVTNVSRPDETHLVTLSVRVAPTRMPAIISDVMQLALLSSDSTVKEPPPLVALKGLDAAALEVELQFRVTSPAKRIAGSKRGPRPRLPPLQGGRAAAGSPAAAAIAIRELPTEETAQPPQVSPWR